MENLEGFKLVEGKGDGKHTACLMSARALLDGRGSTDQHPSKVLRALGIRINDGNWWASAEERTALLLPIALDERLCATKCDSTYAAEKLRAKLCAEWALSFAAPLALDCAAEALKAQWPESAALLSGHADKLRRAPTRENALAAKSDARNAAADAADAAVYAVYAADAAADAAVYAANAANASRKNAWARKGEIRDSLIALFNRLLGVRA